jgi:hypothetical protein
MSNGPCKQTWMEIRSGQERIFEHRSDIFTRGCSGKGLMKGSGRAPGKQFETVPAVIWRLNMAFGEPFRRQMGKAYAGGCDDLSILPTPALCANR